MGTKQSKEEIRELRAEYLEFFPACQFTECFGRFVTFPRHFVKQVCVEHLWGRVGRSAEHWSNYATVLPGPHDWKHENLTIARVAMMWFKHRLARLTKDDRHFDLDVLRDVMGRRPIGWVEVQLETAGLPEWCERMGMDLVEACG